MKPRQYFASCLKLLSRATRALGIKSDWSLSKHKTGGVVAQNADQCGLEQEKDSSRLADKQDESEGEEDDDNKILMRYMGSDTKIYEPGLDSLASFMSYTLMRTKKLSLDWFPQFIVLLNDALLLHGDEVGVRGWCFSSRMALSPSKYKRETRFLGGPSGFFVLCTPTKEFKDSWRESNFETKLQLSSGTLLHHDVDDLTPCFPIWAMDKTGDFNDGWHSNDGLRIPVRNWPSPKYLEKMQLSDPAIKSEEGKPTGVVVGTFKTEGRLRLLCSPAGELYDRAKSSYRSCRAVNTSLQSEWIQAQLEKASDDDQVKQCLVELESNVSEDQMVSYQEARAWVGKAPMAHE